MRKVTRKFVRWGSLTLVGVLVLTACGVGVTRPATRISDISATLEGTVHNTEQAVVTYWFEYGTTTEYGSSTPVEGKYVYYPDQGYPVSARVTGLAEGTVYHYRLCVKDPNGHGLCGGDRSFSTTSGQDSVEGLGVIFSIPEIGFVIGTSVEATSGADGSNPSGEAVLSPGTFYFRISDEGPVTCLRVEGNRAAIGVMVRDPMLSGEPPVTTPRTIFVEDNGPTGDAFAFGPLEAPGTTCPEIPTGPLPPSHVGEFPFGPVVASGDFIVHDHPAGP